MWLPSALGIPCTRSTRWVTSGAARRPSISVPRSTWRYGSTMCSPVSNCAKRISLVFRMEVWVALNQAVHSPDRLASVISVDPIGAIGRPHATFFIRIAPDSVLASVGRSDEALHRLMRVLNNGTTPGQPLLDLSVAGLRTFRGKQPFPRRIQDTDLRGVQTPTMLLFCERSPVNHAQRAAQRSREIDRALDRRSHSGRRSHAAGRTTRDLPQPRTGLHRRSGRGSCKLGRGWC